MSVSFGLNRVHTRRQQRIPQTTHRQHSIMASTATSNSRVAINVSFLHTLVRTRLRFTLRTIMIRVPNNRHHIAPPTVLLVLHGHNTRMNIRLMIKVIVTNLGFLVMGAHHRACTPDIIRAMTTASIRIMAVTIDANTTTLTIRVLVLTATNGGHPPLTGTLPIFPVDRPLITRYVLVQTRHTLNRFQRRHHFP